MLHYYNSLWNNFLRNQRWHSLAQIANTSEDNNAKWHSLALISHCLHIMNRLPMAFIPQITALRLKSLQYAHWVMLLKDDFSSIHRLHYFSCIYITTSVHHAMTYERFDVHIDFDWHSWWNRLLSPFVDLNLLLRLHVKLAWWQHGIESAGRSRVAWGLQFRWYCERFPIPVPGFVGLVFSSGLSNVCLHGVTVYVTDLCCFCFLLWWPCSVASH